MLVKPISFLLLVQAAGLISAYSVPGSKNQPENKGLKFRSPPSKSDGPSRQLPNKASWLPASLSTPKSTTSTMNPLQTRPTATALSQKRASESRLFFTSNKMESEAQVSGRKSLSLFSSLSNTVDKMNTRNQSKALNKHMKSIVSQRRAKARLGTLLKVATVFEETICTEERMAAIRAEFDISDSMVADKFEAESAFEKTEIKLELNEGSETHSGFKIRGLGSIIGGRKAARAEKKGATKAKFTVPISPPSASGDYLSSLSVAPSVSGFGIRSHVDTLSVKASGRKGAGVTSYLDVLTVNSAKTSSRSGLTSASYLDTL